MNKIPLGVALVSLTPSLVLAADLNDSLNTVDILTKGLVGVIVTIAIVVFFWGLVRYLASVGEQKAQGLKTMFYGLITIFVMVSIWGIIALLQNTFQVGGGRRPDIGRPPTISPPPNVPGYPVDVQ